MALHSYRSQEPQTPRVRGLSEPTLVAAGKDWDAIRVEASIGLRALRLLEACGTPVGPVLCDQGSGQAYFLIPPGAARGWQQEHTQALGEGSWIVLAPPGWEDGLLRWVTDPADSSAYTAAADLTIALTAATSARHQQVTPRGRQHAKRQL
ncbi:hypothetical protein [Streptomyces bobili]|uniref:DNA primase/polymerase bifunctional N-terminal domain-containing protein n=1 Tax=Streptomyces bobili TaxID=67280 RepID=A0ABZ1QRB1_9ACTN|nr:hypothetical protein [Streptomyces bobili]